MRAIDIYALTIDVIDSVIQAALRAFATARRSSMSALTGAGCTPASTTATSWRSTRGLTGI